MTNGHFSMKKKHFNYPCCSHISDKTNILLEVHKILSFSAPDSILMKTLQNNSVHSLPHVERALLQCTVSEEVSNITQLIRHVRQNTYAVHAPLKSSSYHSWHISHKMRESWPPYCLLVTAASCPTGSSIVLKSALDLQPYIKWCCYLAIQESDLGTPFSTQSIKIKWNQLEGTAGKETLRGQQRLSKVQ